MDGVAGWSAWRWLILINGIPTILTGIAIPFILPNSPETASFLTETDRQNLLLLRRAEMGQTKSAQEMHWPDVMEGVKDWKTYAFGFCQSANNLMLYSFS
jgi:MFS family permease